MELHRWSIALDQLACQAGSAEEADFYTLWLFDVENSPPAYLVCGCRVYAK